MAFEDLEEFRRMVLADPELQKELRDLNPKTEFINFMIELGSDLGLSFTVEEVQEAMRTGSRAWLERWI